MQYEVKKFDLPEMEGLSRNGIEQHIGLYEGYVKNFNAISAEIEDLLQDPEKHLLAIAELRRRHSFEFDGMKLHEYYFAQWEGTSTPLTASGSLAAALTKYWGSVDATIARVRQTGMMRGPGWSILYYNPDSSMFHMGWIEEQHVGHFATLPIILALDVWEHAFILDYGAAGKAKYIDAFFRNLNWRVLEERFESAARR